MVIILLKSIYSYQIMPPAYLTFKKFKIIFLIIFILNFFDYLQKSDLEFNSNVNYFF